MLGSEYVLSGTEEPPMEPVERAGLGPTEVASVCCQTVQTLFLNEGRDGELDR